MTRTFAGQTTILTVGIVQKVTPCDIDGPSLQIVQSERAKTKIDHLSQQNRTTSRILVQKRLEVERFLSGF